LKDVKWYIKTCHECQIFNTFKPHIPPVVPEPASLFRRAHVDTMVMPPSEGYCYIAHARCSMSAWPEWRALRRETAATLGEFLFQDILCRWGVIAEIVTDNGTPWVAALDYLGDKYHIWHIRITPYNSQAQGVIERQHQTLRRLLERMCGSDFSNWRRHAPYAVWADRVTTRRSTGYSPYYMVHGIEPVLPMDIAEATFLAPCLDEWMSTEDLIAVRARQLEKREDDLEDMRLDIWKSRREAAERFE
jgi:hypothetical protein